jgi:hypothetical protein
VAYKALSEYNTVSKKKRSPGGLPNSNWLYYSDKNEF